MESTLSGLKIGPFSASALTDFDSTVFVQLAIFLILIFILNKLLFKPYLEVVKKRESMGSGTREIALQVEKNANDLIEKYESSLKKARAEAAKVRQDLQEEARSKESEIIATVRTDSENLVKTEKEKIATQVDTASRELENTARQLSSIMVSRVMPS